LDNRFFKTKFDVIEQKIIEKGKTIQKADNSEVFIFDDCHETGDKKRGVEMLSQFIVAIFEKRKIQVKIVQSKPVLIVVKENDRETTELDFQTIIDMRLSDEKYNSQDRGYYKNLNTKKVDVAS